MTPTQQLRRIALELAAQAQTGCAFATDRYVKRRYARQGAMADELLALLDSNVDPGTLSAALEQHGAGDATPKVGVCGALFDDAERVLLVQEVRNGLWTLPGGWADVLDAPRASVEREFAEEAGLEVRAVRLAGVFDGTVSNGHGDRGLPFHIWKLFWLCEQVDTTAQPRAGLDGETSDVGWFKLADLPPLSTQQTTAEQLAAILARYLDPTIAPHQD